MSATAATAPVLDIRGVVKAFGDNVVLRGIDITVGEHQVVRGVGIEEAGAQLVVHAPTLARPGGRPVDAGCAPAVGQAPARTFSSPSTSARIREWRWP